MCQCGRPMNSFEPGTPIHSSISLPANINWKSNDEFTIEASTNAFGEIYFSNTSKIKSKVY